MLISLFFFPESVDGIRLFLVVLCSCGVYSFRGTVDLVTIAKKKLKAHRLLLIPRHGFLYIYLFKRSYMFILVTCEQ
ncbi:hypothetical protein LINPERHAP2_LOCUS42471 [Linum perenne]